MHKTVVTELKSCLRMIKVIFIKLCKRMIKDLQNAGYLSAGPTDLIQGQPALEMPHCQETEHQSQHSNSSLGSLP